jgi:hypothetical protein
MAIDTWGPLGLTNFSVDAQQQQALNVLALGVAHRLSAPDLGPRINAWQNLEDLCRHRLVTEPRIIPILLERLKKPRPGNESDEIRMTLQSLSAMTRRMSYAQRFESMRLYRSGPAGRGQVIQWWESWWQNNKDKHPVYDYEVDQKLKRELLRVERTIEQEVKPDFAQLASFTANTNLAHIPLNGLMTELYEDRYSPNTFGGLPPPPLLEIAGHFEGPPPPDMPPNTSGSPQRWANMLTSVYSNKLEGTAVYLEVKVDSRSTNLVTALRRTLSDTKGH